MFLPHTKLKWKSEKPRLLYYVPMGAKPSPLLQAAGFYDQASWLAILLLLATPAPTAALPMLAPFTCYYCYYSFIIEC